ncbi:MAG: secretin N-terminal domain-containing protein [Paracoccaceae bacterium]
MTRGTEAPTRRARRALAAILALMSLAALVGCAAPGAQTEDAPRLVVVLDPATDSEVYTTSREAFRIVIPRPSRATTFSGDAQARLAAPGQRGQTGFINTGAVNAGPDADNTRTQVNLTLSANADVEVEPLNQVRIDGELFQPRFDGTPSVTLNFEQEDLRQIIQNILGGILGQNFITGDSVQGTVTFRSNERFAPSQLVQILADIVAREGFVLRYFNGVYHIGTPEELQRLAASRGASTLDNEQLYIIELPAGTGGEDGDGAQELVGVLSSLIPTSNQVFVVPGTGNIGVRGDPSQFQSVENLVRTLVGTGIADQELTIVPLRAASPDVVATEILNLYSERGIGGVSVIPLEAQQSVMLAADSRRKLADLRRLLRSLDVDRRDQATLRVIQLVHSPAEEVAAQLNAAFGNGVDVQPPQPAQGGGSAVLQAAADRGSQSAAQSTGVVAPSVAGGSGAPPAAPLPPAIAGALPSGEGLSVVADTRNNALMVRSTFQEFRRIREVVRALDTPLAQVVIEATILEVDITDDLSYGVQFFLNSNGITVRSSSGGTGAPGAIGGQGFGGTYSGSIGSVGIEAVVSALQSVTDVRVVSSPYLTVVDGASANLSVGDQIPFVVTSQSSSSDGQVTVTQEIQSQSVGVNLDVTPNIRPDNTVLLDVSQSVSSARVEATTAGPNPIISQRSVNSQITVESGYTVLLGGLITERSDSQGGGVPIARDIPVLGGLFEQRSNRMGRSELLVMITPRVVRTTDSLAGITQQVRWYTNQN